MAVGYSAEALAIAQRAAAQGNNVARTVPFIVNHPVATAALLGKAFADNGFDAWVSWCAGSSPELMAERVGDAGLPEPVAEVEQAARRHPLACLREFTNPLGAE